MTHPRVLLLIPSYIKPGARLLAAAGRHPTMDYHALQAELCADIADYASVDEDRHPLVNLARKAGKDAALAMHGFLRRRQYDVIFSNGENVSIPLAALFKCGGWRPGHVLIGHHLSPAKKKRFLRALHPEMDAIFVYAATQRTYAGETLGIPEAKLHLIPFHADQQFYRPIGEETGNIICSAGLEWRDYPTLLEAVKGLDVEVRLAAASPWSKHRNETENREMPPNVSARRYEYHELRQLYAESRFVVVPLYENDFQAGVTTILEAMAMGKAVVSTEAGIHGLDLARGKDVTVADSADALANAITRLLDSPEERKALERHARGTAEERYGWDAIAREQKRLYDSL